MSIYSAQQLASMGRGNDSMLVHMTPREVGGLQALAMAQGGSLSINPKTGLPEAGFLDRLLPTLIGAGLTFFSGGMIDPITAAGIVGGGETIRTGDLGKGFMAGLGAFGGGGLGSALTGAGSLGAQAAAGQTAGIAGTDAASQAAKSIMSGGPNTLLNQGFLGTTPQVGTDVAAEAAKGIMAPQGIPAATKFTDLPFLDQAKSSLATLGQPGGLSNLGNNLIGQYGGKYGAMAAAYPLVSEIMRPPDVKFPEQEKYEAKPPALPMPRLYNPIQKDPRKISSEYNFFEPSNPYPGFMRG